MTSQNATRFSQRMIWLAIEWLLTFGVWSVLHFYFVADALDYVNAGGHGKAAGILFFGVCALAWVIAHSICDMVRSFKEVFIDAR